MFASFIHAPRGRALPGAQWPLPAAVALALGLAMLAASPATTSAARARGPLKSEATTVAGAESAPRLLTLESLVARAGETVELRWTLPGPGIDELEILLSMDGGRRFPLRVSPEIDARTGRYLWHVPRGLSGQARLRVRYNLQGQETFGEPTAAFAILSVAAREAPEAAVHEGDWWSGARTLDAPGSAAAFLSPFQRLSSGADLPPTGIVARGAALSEPSRRHTRPERTMSGEVAATLQLGVTAPRFTPLRN